jgi:hypothetical protein
MAYRRRPELIVGGFPKGLSVEALQLARVLSNIEVFDEYMQAIVDGEELAIPQRIHFKGDEQNASEDIFLLCALSRSTDGYAREAALRKILSGTVPHWAIPYVFVALGDYVFQVSKLVLDANEDTKAALRNFVKGNPELARLIEARTISYWNEYYAAAFSGYKRYPPYRFLSELLNP